MTSPERRQSIRLSRLGRWMRIAGGVEGGAPPQWKENRWLKMENPTSMDDLGGVSLFHETSTYEYCNYVYISIYIYIYIIYIYSCIYKYIFVHLKSQQFKIFCNDWILTYCLWKHSSFPQNRSNWTNRPKVQFLGCWIPTLASMHELARMP